MSGARPEPGSRSFEEQVRQRAYEIYLSRKREDAPGDAVSDWVRAEQELRRSR
jgi:hypothetical protein